MTSLRRGCLVNGVQRPQRDAHNAVVMAWGVVTVTPLNFGFKKLEVEDMFHFGCIESFSFECKDVVSVLRVF